MQLNNIKSVVQITDQYRFLEKQPVFIRKSEKSQLSVLLSVPCIILALLCGNVPSAFSQSSKDACLKDVKLIYQKFKMMSNSGVPKDKTYYFNYTVRTATKDSLDSGVFTSNVAMWASGNNLQVKSKEMEMYQNPDDAFIILPQRKQLVRLDPYYKNEKDKSVLSSKINMIQDTLFALSKVVKCETKADKKTIVLEVNDKGRKFLNVRRMTFIINTKEQEFVKLKIEYENMDNGLYKDVVYVEYNFNEVSYDYKAKTLNENLSKKFLKSSKEPSAGYTGYTVVDNRVKKNNQAGKQWK